MCKTTRSGDPGHEDRTASLSVGLGEDGRILINCHAGCVAEDVVSKLGLKMADLMPLANGHSPNDKRRIVKTYDYHDEHGEVLFQVVRFDPKDFRQRRPKEGGEWNWSVKGIRKVPYRLPALIQAGLAKPVLIVEGEKDADLLVGLGATATCNAGGASKWSSDYNQHLYGRKVVVFADNDDAGREHARQVATSLRGIAASIRVVELPGLPEKGDVSDWFAAGGTVEQLRGVIKSAPLWIPNSKQVAERQPKSKARQARSKKANIPEFRPFPTAVLPPAIRRFVQEGATALGCDESYIAVPLLAAMASAVGNARRIQLKRSWCEPCVIWAVTVGESGTLKSPALDLVLEPLIALQNSEFRRHADAMKQYVIDKATHDVDLTAWKRKGRNRLEPPPEEPEEPSPFRYLVADATIEALAVLLEQQPRGLFMARDELSGWVNSFDAYKTCKGVDVAHWLSVHRAGSLVVDRKTGRRTIHAPRAAVSIAGGVQPKALAAALAGRAQGDEDSDREHFENGLAARLLFTMPPRRPKRWTDDDIDRLTEAAVGHVFEQLFRLEPTVDDNDHDQPVDLPLTASAKSAWIHFYNQHASEQATMSGDLAAAWSKLEGYAAQLALLVHLIRSTSGDRTLADQDAIDEQSIQAGITLSRWFGEEAARVYAVLGGNQESPDDRGRREVLRLIRSRDGRITVRELMHAKRKFRTSAEDAERFLADLAKHGHGCLKTETHSHKGGRPVTVFEVADGDCDGNTTPSDPEENEVLLPLPGDSMCNSPTREDEDEIVELGEGE